MAEIHTFQNKGKSKKKSAQIAESKVIDMQLRRPVEAAKRGIKRELEGQPIEVKFSDAFLDAGDAVDSNIRELERLFPAGHPAYNSIERLAMISTYLINCSKTAADQGF